jgi:hypothetical protein
MNKGMVGLIGFLVGVLIACNGNNNPIVDPVDKTPPTLISTLPAANANNVDLDSPITASLSEDIDSSTVAANVSLKQVSNNQNISVSPSLNADTISLGHPALSQRTTYQASLGSLKDLSGNAFAGTTWNFTTRDGMWHDPQEIDDPLLGSAVPQMAMAADGSAMAVWVTSPNATSSFVWANHYTPAKGWGTPKQIETQTPRYRSPLGVGVDDFGNAIAIWEQADAIAGRHDIVASHYTPAGGWAAPEAVETEDVRTAVNPVIAMNSSGQAVAAWAQNDGTRANVWANLYTPSTGWGTPKLIETNDTGNANRPQVAIDSGGNAHVVWIQDLGSVKPSIWGNLYRPGTGWDVGFPLENETAAAANPSLGFNSSGNVMVVWDQIEEKVISPNQTIGYWHVWVNLYTPSTGWGVAGRIPTANDNSTYSGLARVALDPKGNAIAIWLQNAGDQTRNDVWANRFEFGKGWGTAMALAPLQSNKNNNSLQVALDPSGNAIATWLNDNGFLQHNRYLADTGWGTAKGVQQSSPQQVTSLAQMSINSAGNALAVFSLIGSHVWATEFK